MTIVLAGMLLAGCSMANDALWPSLTGESPSGDSQQSSTSKANATQQTSVTPPPPPSLGNTNFVPPQVSSAAPSGTYVGQRIVELRSQLQRLRSEITSENNQLQTIRAQTRQHSQIYHNTIANVNTRLQVGTTPGNPQLVNQWNLAQASLAQIDNDVAQMNSLANQVAGTSSLAAYLLETTRAAYGLSGAVDEDHRQLATLEDEVNRTVVLIDRLLNELSSDINRQTNYVSAERTNLTTLALAIKNGEMLGQSLGNSAYASAAPASSQGFGASPMSGGARRPLVVIRFDRPNVDYEQPLYNAVSRALQRRPNATFDLVAVSPNNGNAARATLQSTEAKRNAERVLRSLANMGLPLSRVRLSALSSNTAQTNEVHLYVR